MTSTPPDPHTTDPVEACWPSDEAPSQGPAPDRLVWGALREDAETLALIEMADRYMATVGYTDHGLAHLDRVARRAFGLLVTLRKPRREAELAAVAGLLHDIGNALHRDEHAQSGALMALGLLTRRGMSVEEAAVVSAAIANHDETNGEPISNVGAALILADKSDVLRGRVRNPEMIRTDIHDRVNYAAQSTCMSADGAARRITLSLEIDTKICQVMEYFEIFIARMRMSRRAANLLECDFQLIINDTQML